MKKLWTLLLTLVFVVGLISPAIITTAYASNDVVMTVNGEEFTSHSEGWVKAHSVTNDGKHSVAKIKLFADWTAESTGFVCDDDNSINATKDGALYAYGGSYSIDLNGYTIDRNAPENSASSPVFYLEACTFTIEDTSETKNGKITGGFGDNGGGIYAKGTAIYFNGGNIIGNKAAKNGGGIYLYDSSKLYLNGGCISDNEANQGGGVYLDDGDFEMNGGCISDNEANQGGGVYLYGDNFDLNDGVIARNRATGSGGGVYSYDTFIMNGGVIEENYSGSSGGGAFFEFNKNFEMNGGIFRNNTAKWSGGAISSIIDNRKADTFYKLNIRKGTFTDNTALNGSGGAIFWNEGSIYLVDCTITGNSAPNGYGGGLFRQFEGTSTLYLGGTLNITGNTAYTDRADSNSNIYASNPGGMRLFSDEITRLKADSKIGVSFKNAYLNSYFNGSADGILTFGLSSGAADCFISDDPCYQVTKSEGGKGFYNVYLVEDPNPSYEGDPVFTVETQEGGKKEFYNRTEGWVYAIEQSQKNDVKLTLYRDWVAHNSKFSYRKGTYNGALYISDNCLYNITIDLNGYTIDRGLTEPEKDGWVFYMNTKGSLAIMDSSKEQTGTITGGYSCSSNIIVDDSKGGAFFIDYGTLYFKGGTITGNKAAYGAGIYCDDQDDAFVYMQGGKIAGNTAFKEGGGIYMENGYLYLEGGEIRDNTAEYGGGIYWNSDNDAYLTGGIITGNYASEYGGGMYVSNRGYIYLGGDVQITDNNEGNLYLSGSYANISNAKGQDGAPNKPLKEGAKIGISSGKIEEEISASNSMFAEGDFRFLYSDYDRYFIRSVYDVNGGNHSHKLYINTWAHADARYPRVKTVSVKDSNLLEDVVFDYDTQTITLVAHNTRKNFFERAVLSDLIECTYDKDIYYLYQMDYMRDLRNPQEYKIMSDNGTYVICKVNLVPEGGAWSDNQESINNPYKMTVSQGLSIKGFTDFGDGWKYAVSQSNPVTITLFEDWVAPDGKFNYSMGTNGGYLYLDEDYMNITIDLNGNTLSRGLTSATSNGYLFRIEGGAKLTITDNSDRGDGKITGGYNKGDGGAFYVDYGKLYINGGEIVGNKANGDGGAIYGTNEDDTFIYINDGKICNNTAIENGGAIFMYNGSLYVDGGEISGNTAEYGGGIYWDSRDILCLTGGKIINNSSYKGSGVYATDWGDIYLGGTAVVKDNITITNIIYRDFFLEDDDVVINHAAGQNADVPNKPLTDGAQIVIDPKKSGYCISDSDSRFNMESIQYLSSGNGVCVVGGIYDENGGNNKYKIYSFYTSSTFAPPRVESVTSESDIVSQVSVDNNSHVITLTADMKAQKSGELKSVKLNALIDATFNKEGVRIVDMDSYRDFTKSQKFMIMDTDKLYTVYTVKVEWVCSEHTDEDGDYVCDDCKEYTLSNATIVNYNAQTQEATIFVPEAGKYALIFADYEDTRLANVDIVEYDFVEGINIVPQEITNFTLTSGDKVLLWYDMINLVPVCEALTIK